MRKKISTYIKDFFITGIVFLLPVILTIAVVKFIFGLLVRWLAPLVDYIPSGFHIIPHPEIIFGFVLIFVIGYFIRVFLLHIIIDFIEINFLKHVPIVSQIYFSIKQILLIVNKKNDAKKDQQQVAWVRLPHRGVHCLGFMTGVLPTEIAPYKDVPYYSFFIPTTPNPVTGYYIAVAQEDCIFVNMTRQEALSLIISGGMIKPDKKV